MLLIEPPVTSEEWTDLRTQDAGFSQFFCQYCDQYFSAVLSLPGDQIGKVIEYMCGGLEEWHIDAWSFHTIVQRELQEREYEASSKVARIVILCALGETLSNHGYEMYQRTERLLNRCWELIPIVLMLAVDDHFGLLTAECC
ncbi:MAG: hypothetical protein CMJ64_20485 [Planctomycetaceae bacterium]|nr:hypothetical protein [Planctomycetaceae bacterium]